MLASKHGPDFALARRTALDLRAVLPLVGRTVVPKVEVRALRARVVALARSLSGRRGVITLGCSTGKRRSYPFMHDQYVVQYANSDYELYAEFGIN